MPSCCVWEQKTEADRGRCDVLFVVKKSCTMFHMVYLLRFSMPPPRSPAGEKGVGDKLCHSPLRLVVTIPPLSKTPQQKGWWGIAGDVCGSLKDTCGEPLDMGDSRFLWCHSSTVSCPRTGPSHLIRLDMPGETPVTLYPEGLIVLLQYLVIWCLLKQPFLGMS